MGEFYLYISEQLKDYSPIVIIMHQDLFFIEDEPLDPRLSTTKILNHYKKSGIQSISFENGLIKDGS